MFFFIFSSVIFISLTLIEKSWIVHYSMCFVQSPSKKAITNQVEFVRLVSILSIRLSDPNLNCFWMCFDYFWMSLYDLQANSKFSSSKMTEVREISLARQEKKKMRNESYFVIRPGRREKRDERRHFNSYGRCNYVSFVLFIVRVCVYHRFVQSQNSQWPNSLRNKELNELTIVLKLNMNQRIYQTL